MYKYWHIYYKAVCRSTRQRLLLSDVLTIKKKFSYPADPIFSDGEVPPGWVRRLDFLSLGGVKGISRAGPRGC